MIVKNIFQKNHWNKSFASIFLCLFFGLCTSLPMVFSQEAPGSLLMIHWEDLTWQPGVREQVIPVKQDATSNISFWISVEVETKAKGSFTAYNMHSPYVDGKEVVNFGDHPNLGVMFDPVSGQDLSPVVVRLKFSQPVQYLGFRISDIDAAEGRVDSVFVYGNEKEIFPHLSILSSNPTVKVAGRTATALGGESGSVGNGSAFGGESNGDVLVTFGDEYLDSVTVIYYEVSGKDDPSARGIGLFGDLSFQLARLYPMNLLKFGIVLDENCMPIVRWSANQEFALEEYVIEYSYDGYNFSRAGALLATNQYTNEVDYEIALNRSLNTDNYFRLVKVDFEGNQEVLTSESMSGSACFNFTAVNVYPNPSSGNFVYVEIEATDQKMTEIAIVDQYGEILVQTKYALKRGRNLFKLESRLLVPGVYNLRFTIDQEVVTKRVSIIE